MNVRIFEKPFRPWEILAEHEAACGLNTGRVGAAAVFVGTMRDFNDDSTVESLTLEHYPGMTEAHLNRIRERAHSRWPLDDSLICHRIGTLLPGDPIVLVAAWSAHRAAAFDACRFIMEDLKSEAPFWKKEVRPDGERWVARNTPGGVTVDDGEA